MPSRWERRSKEEKDRIRRDQEAQRYHSREARDLRSVWARSHHRKNEVYDQGELPLLCGHCGYMESEEYVLSDEKGFFAALVPNGYIAGRCINCGRELLEEVTKDPEELKRFNTILENLVTDGRATDERGKGDSEAPVIRKR